MAQLTANDYLVYDTSQLLLYNMQYRVLVLGIL